MIKTNLEVGRLELNEYAICSFVKCGFVIDFLHDKVYYKNEDLKLNNQPRQLLLLLLINNNKSVPTSIIKSSMGIDNNNHVAVCIYELRQKLKHITKVKKTENGYGLFID